MEAQIIDNQTNHEGTRDSFNIDESLRYLKIEGKSRERLREETVFQARRKITQ